MKLIVGLGNIGKEYEHTRHNAGFDTIEKLAAILNVEISQIKFQAKIATLNYQGEKVILMKPSTYMNNSGEAVIACYNFFKLNPADIIVVYDDLDLPVGKIRLRAKGSAGGQKGMNSIINHLHTNEIKRIRVGIGKDPLIPVVDYVSGKHSKADRKLFEEASDRAAQALKDSLSLDFDVVMNRYN